MANKKINQLDTRVGAALTDLILIGDPTSGTSFKLTATDFRTLLNSVPYTGATTNVNLGEFGLVTGQITFDTTPTGIASVATTRWNDTTGVSETTLKGGNVVLKNGVDLVARVVNKITPNTTLTKAAYQAVKISGAQGQRLAVELAQANNDANSADTIGLVTETIAPNQEGFIMTVGQLEGINTTGSLQGETWADGDVLYLSPTTAGAITKVKPTGATGHLVIIGYVEYAHANNGKIYVKITNGFELEELHDVAISNPLNDQVLTYESSTQLWKNKTASGGGTPAGSNTQIQYNNSGAFGASASFTYTDTTGIINLIKSIPNTGLEFIITNTSNTGNALSQFVAKNATGDIASFGKVGAGYSYKMLTAGDGVVYTQGGNLSLFCDTGSFIKFGAGGTSTAQMTLTAAGRLLLGTVSESTFLLDVNGTARVSGNATINGSIYATSSSSDGVLQLNQTAVGFAAQVINRVNTTNTSALIAFQDLKTGANSRSFSIGIGRSGDPQWADGDFIFAYYTGSGGWQQSAKIFNATGNWSIGSSTLDQGYKLDVNGTARVSVLNIKDGGTPVSTSISSGTTYGLNIRGTSGSLYDISFLENTGYNGAFINSLGQLKIGVYNSTYNSSAILEAVSTTKGFLPPRMTTTQKNAIGTPAQGLMVFDTTLVKLCVYNGTAWETITSI